MCGWRVLEAIGIEPEICHLNEGHAAFLVLERARSFMKKENASFEVALTATRKGNHFTTHTAVAAGFDNFSPELIAKYLSRYAENELHISLQELLALGQLHSQGNFNMAYLALRGSGSSNGVSKLHGCVSRALFKDLFPRFPEEEVPIGYVTNGVHIPTWDSALSNDLWTGACRKKCWLSKTEDLDKKIRAVPDADIWNMRNQSRSLLIDETRRRLIRQLSARGSSTEEIEKVVLTLKNKYM